MKTADKQLETHTQTHTQVKIERKKQMCCKEKYNKKHMKRRTKEELVRERERKCLRKGDIKKGRTKSVGRASENDTSFPLPLSKKNSTQINHTSKTG